MGVYSSVGWGVDEVCTGSVYSVYSVYSVGWRVDEVCTGSPVSMDGVVMDSVTSASYSALAASDIRALD